MTPIVDEIRLIVEAKAAALISRKVGDLASLIQDDVVYVNASGRSFNKASYIDAYCTSGQA